jgi:16S rRNA (guanine966-N2)-methyltransferase
VHTRKEPVALLARLTCGQNARMRIIAGTHRGARIAAPKGLSTRPTGDRVREAAFNLIGPVDGAAVLDLFAGSGAMGLEALSRGAASVTFVESDKAACRTIAQNLEKLKLTGARVVCADAVWAVRQESRAYDLVLVDPPYESWAELERRLAEHVPRVLAPRGLLVVETGARTEPSLPLPLRTSRRYGSARLTLFEHP